MVIVHGTGQGNVSPDVRSRIKEVPIAIGSLTVPRRFGIAAFLLMPGCGPEPIGPSGRLLIGSWGSTEAELVAALTRAEVRLSCATIIIGRPIGLTEDNTFAVRGRLDTSGAELGSLPIVDVTGSVTGSRVSLAVPAAVGGDPLTFVLEAGVTPPPHEVPYCPL